MPIQKKWSDYTKDNLLKETNNIGVYQIANKNLNEILYIGEGNIRDRLLAHFPDNTRTHEIVVGADSYRYEETNNKLRAVQRQNALLKEFMDSHNGKLPKFNQKSKN